MYTQRITRTNPWLYVFLIDQSGSMWQQTWWISQAEAVRNIVNEYIDTMIIQSTSWETIKDHFYISAIWYGSNSGVDFAFQWALRWKDILPLSEIADNSLTMIQRDWASFPIWFEAIAEWQTPMKAWFELAKSVIEKFIKFYPNTYPPIIINITDWASTDWSPEWIAHEIKKLSTNDWNVLIFNAHIVANKASSILYPSAELDLPNDPNALMLYNISSQFPEEMIEIAWTQNIFLKTGQKWYIYNSPVSELHKFLNIGTIGTLSSPILPG